MAKKVQQMHITVDDAVGKLAELTGKIKDAGVNIYSLVAWVEGDKGHLLAVTDDNTTACANLSGVVVDCSESEALYVELAHKPGALHTVAQKLADAGIGIEMIYATTAQADKAGVVLNTSDNTQAATLV